MTDRFVLDELERCLHRGTARQARRQFLRLLRRFWPVSPDPERHPRLSAFLARYEGEKDANPSSP